jgi:large subunit ribosomal protein L21
MKVVLETGGKQYYAQEGDVLYIEKLNKEAGETFTFEKVLAVDGVYGSPYLDNVLVTGEVIKTGKQKKIIVFHYNPKKKFRKKQGHRQPYTSVLVKTIKVS